MHWLPVEMVLASQTQDCQSPLLQEERTLFQQESRQEGKLAKMPGAPPLPGPQFPPGGPWGTAAARARREEAATACFILTMCGVLC